MDFNFDIQPKGKVSKAFLAKSIYDFRSAAHFVKALPYNRNKNKTDALCVLQDHFGTCSTKHALLKNLASENNADEVKLILGIFRMNAFNTPKVASVLMHYNLDYIPEAHNYLKINDEILECTNINSSAADFIDELMIEKEISQEQITGFKIDYHKNFLQNWLLNENINMTLYESWLAREACIAALGENVKTEKV